MNAEPPRDAQRREIDRQVRDLFAQSASFQSMAPAERDEIVRNTASIVDTMAQNRLSQLSGRGAEALQGGVATLPGMSGPPGQATQPAFTGGAQPGSSAALAPTKIGDFGTGVAVGVGQAGELLRQVSFPAFVAELVQGVFQAVVDASIKQMKAYGELVQAVTMSLNDFRDTNVSENQARDHLVGKFPNLMQINVTDSGPRVGLRPGIDADDELDRITQSLGLSQTPSSLDDETVEELLVPAARNDLARSRQSLLATMVLMGINRIVVTDGKINAKLKFDFRARDAMTTNAVDYDYKNFGTTRASQSTWESGQETGENYARKSSWGSSTESGESSRWSSGQYQYTEAPAIYLSNITNTTTTADLEASAKLSGEVSLNFKSETFDLNQLASADEVFRLERVRGAGRGAPGAAAAAPSGTPPAGENPPPGGTPTP